MRPTRWLLPLVLFAALAGASPTPPASATKPAPWLTVKMEGGLVAYVPTYTIDAAGLARVEITDTHGHWDYATQLSPAELAWFKCVAGQANFAENPGRRAAVTDVPTKTVTLVADGKTRTAIFIMDPTFDPLLQCLDKLATQARALEDLKRGSTNTVDSGVNPHRAAQKVLQPRAFLQPLQEYLLKARTGADEHALEALAYIATPEEFAGTIAQLVEGSQGKDRRLLFEKICATPYRSNIPKSQLQAYWPLLRAERDALKAQASPSEDERQVLRAIDGVYSDLFPR